MSRIKNENELKMLYVADCLKMDYPKVYEQLEDAIGSHLGIIKGCKDYWVRDFMPLNTNDGEFLWFDYDPDYLKRKKTASFVLTRVCC